MGRCSAGAAECATTKTSNPTTFTSVRRPNDRVNVETRDGEEDLLAHLTSPVFPRSLLSPGFDAPRRRDPQNATRRARDHCGSPAARSPASRGVRTLSLGKRVITIQHESIRHEVFAAAAAAATEAAKVGEQRRRIHGRYPQPDIGVGHAGATQGLVDVVVDAGTRLPFAIHRHVRLDARVPTCVNVTPSRLLRLALTCVDRIGSEREGKRVGRRKQREKKREDR